MGPTAVSETLSVNSPHTVQKPQNKTKRGPTFHVCLHAYALSHDATTHWLYDCHNLFVFKQIVAQIKIS